MTAYRNYYFLSVIPFLSTVDSFCVTNYFILMSRNFLPRDESFDSFVLNFCATFLLFQKM